MSASPASGAATTPASTGITLSDVLARHALVRPDTVAFVDPRRRCSFRQLDDRATRLANALQARGIRRGDRVAVLGLNSLELVESWLAALRLGAIAVPVNFRMREEELAYATRRKADEFDFGYVMTVHKAQGSQWDEVVLFDESYAFREHRARWLYTGLTRAAKRLTVVV